MNTNFDVLRVCVLFFAMSIILSSCSSGSGSDPVVVNQDASGLYTGSGTFNADAQKTMTKVKGMVQGGKFIFFDVTTNILYEGTLTTKLSNVAGTAVVYEAGGMVNAAVVVTGTVTNGAKIQLTFAAKGKFKGGSIDAIYDDQYKRAADNARIFADGTTANPKWEGVVNMKIPNMATTSFDVAKDNTYTLISIESGAGATARCDHSGTVTLSNVNIYTLSETLTKTTNCTLTDTPAYKGYMAVVDDSANGFDKGMWYAVTNGSNSVFAILKH